MASSSDGLLAPRSSEQQSRRLEEVTQWILEALDSVVAFGHVQRQIRSDRDPAALFVAARSQVRRLVNFDALAFLTVDERSDFVVADCDPESERSSVQQDVEEAIRRGLFAWAVSQNRAVTVRSPRPGHTLVLHSLVSGSRVVGMFAGLVRDDESDLTPAASNLLSLILFNTAQAFENATLYQRIQMHARSLEQSVEARTRELQEALEQATTLLGISRALSSTLELEPLLDHLLREVARTIEADSVGVWLVDRETGWLRPMADYGLPPDVAVSLRAYRIDVRDGSFYADGIGDKRIQTAAAVADDPRIPASMKAAAPHRSQLFVPIVARDEVIAAFIALWWTRTRSFSARELGLLEAIGSQAGAALENARLYQSAQQAYGELSRTKDQLAQAQKIEAVGRLAGGIAHDFNNLLTVITGHAHLLQDIVRPDDPLRRHAEVIRQTAERAAALTQQLLAFSRKQVLQPKEFELNAVVRNMELMLRRLIGEHIEVVTVCDPMAGHVKADLSQLEQVIVNLTVNARDAMPDGGRLTLVTSNVELDAAFVRDHPEARVGPCVRLDVTDTGVGMDADVRAHLFEPFFTTKGVGRGTGLGLATVYGIVKQSDGYISVESTPGQGSRFTIYLPRVTGEAEAVALSDDVRKIPRGAGTILVVEDEAQVRALVVEMLEMNGYSVLQAANGVDAVGLVERHTGPIDLVLTDVVMPRMGGHLLADRLARIRPQMKVLFMSGYTDDALGPNGFAPGTAFLQKPFPPAALAREIHALLADRPRSADAVSAPDVSPVA